ncbi:MAG: type II secretion system minor pseudopilin GspJ [Gammaproteobacteria bacterium]|nr:type II secretion system minor pseudopilin GspJ [Gammaproteobacteria bacterium]
MKRVSGFTLLELLVAMAVFSIVGLAATAGLNAVIDQSSLATSSMKDLSQLQRSIVFLTNDLYQMHPRVVRDELGRGDETPLLADGQDSYLLRFSREGWRNPAGLPRGTIQRVQYRLEEETLIREHWAVTDRTLGLEPIELELLNNVTDVKFEYLDYGNQWNSLWPSVKPGGETEEWPRAVRVTITLKNIGEIQRLIEISG